MAARTGEFLMDLDAGMLAYFREMAHEMVTRFGIPRAEAVARINRAYTQRHITPYPDPMCRELPEYWGYGLYFRPNGGRLPDDDPDRDLSVWEVRPPPPRDSAHWTVRPAGD
ncbi:hypothetical protein [Streptomyces sp. NPDC005485]|uniref:hypothetical protein n=1 Tax=Streptomyces sp. NPDC005485 TaxID=3155591 RepID=UPI0033B7666A